MNKKTAGMLAAAGLVGVTLAVGALIGPRPLRRLEQQLPPGVPRVWLDILRKHTTAREYASLMSEAAGILQGGGGIPEVTNLMRQRLSPAQVNAIMADLRANVSDQMKGLPQ